MAGIGDFLIGATVGGLKAVDEEERKNMELMRQMDLKSWAYKMQRAYDMQALGLGPNATEEEAASRRGEIAATQELATLRAHMGNPNATYAEATLWKANLSGQAQSAQAGGRRGMEWLSPEDEKALAFRAELDLLDEKQMKELELKFKYIKDPMYRDMLLASAALEQEAAGVKLSAEFHQKLDLLRNEWFTDGRALDGPELDLATKQIIANMVGISKASRGASGSTLLGGDLWGDAGNGQPATSVQLDQQATVFRSAIYQVVGEIPMAAVTNEANWKDAKVNQGQVDQIRLGIINYKRALLGEKSTLDGQELDPLARLHALANSINKSGMHEDQKKQLITTLTSMPDAVFEINQRMSELQKTTGGLNWASPEITRKRIADAYSRGAPIRGSMFLMDTPAKGEQAPQGPGLPVQPPYMPGQHPTSSEMQQNPGLLGGGQPPAGPQQQPQPQGPMGPPAPGPTPGGAAPDPTAVAEPAPEPILEPTPPPQPAEAPPEAATPANEEVMNRALRGVQALVKNKVVTKSQLMTALQSGELTGPLKIQIGNIVKQANIGNKGPALTVEQVIQELLNQMGG